MEVFLTEKAFVGLILSAIEVYKNECLGALLGYNLRNKIVVEYAIPYQSAKRKYTEVEPNWRRESKIQELIPLLTPLQHLGYFHSHTQWGDTKALSALSQVDRETIEPAQIEIVIAVNDSKRRIKWETTGKELYGTIRNHKIRMAC
ncbi:hypothetical protein DRO56_00580 [Candidatus Bathyarchaeota archaeon]|nr:MAG: hypothetical protein CW700_05490 [Candidatus Bathyarchaeota archaeon]RLI33883.1 MAG: hypothetical protein DRO56_00580 [Candidatus Bathyarchaeota archaeon]